MLQVDENAEVSSLTALKPRSKKWHLEPVSVTKISKKDQDTREPYTVSEVKESHSVFSNLNGNRHRFKQEHQQGKNCISCHTWPSLVKRKATAQLNQKLVFLVATGCISKM